MLSLQIPSSQLVNYIPSYNIQMSIKTFITICLTFILLSFISCLILIYKFSQKNKKLETDKKDDLMKYNAIKEDKNNLIEEELKNIKLIINLLQDEFHNKYTELENKNNILEEQLLKIKLKKEIETQLQEQDKNNLLVDEYKNLKDELNVLTHKFTYYHSKQDDNLNLLTEDLRKINRKIEQQQINQEKNNLLSDEIKNLKNEIDVYLTEKIKYINLNQNEKINLLEENIGKILNKLNQQKQIIENNKNQCVRFNSFLDNYSINRHSFSSIRLNGSTLIPMDSMSSIGISTLRILYSIKQKFNIKYYDNYNKIRISQHINDNATSRNLLIEITIIDDEKATENTTHFHSRQFPLYMLCLIFGTKIITFDGEDVTDLFENNFNSVKRYYDSTIEPFSNQKQKLRNGGFMPFFVPQIPNAIEESKRISNMCNVEYVLEMFK